jgi:hypothetical protein
MFKDLFEKLTTVSEEFGREANAEITPTDNNFESALMQVIEQLPAMDSDNPDVVEDLKGIQELMRPFAEELRAEVVSYDKFQSNFTDADDMLTSTREGTLDWLEEADMVGDNQASLAAEIVGGLDLVLAYLEEFPVQAAEEGYEEDHTSAGDSFESKVKEGDGTIDPDEDVKLDEILKGFHQGVRAEIERTVKSAEKAMGGPNGFAFRGPGFMVRLKDVLKRAVEDGLEVARV